MKKTILVFFLLIIFTCSSCVKKETTQTYNEINLKEIYDNNEYDLQKKLKVIFNNILPTVKYISKDTLSSEDYEKYVNETIYSDFISAILVYTNKKTVRFLVEFESEQKAIEQFNIFRQEYFVYGKYLCYNCGLAYEMSYGIDFIDGYNITHTNVLTYSAEENLNFPQRVLYIANYAFAHSSVSELECNDNLKAIGRYAFYNSSMLSKIKLNEGLLRIEEKAFFDVPINYIIIPSSVTYIGPKAFNKGFVFIDKNKSHTNYSSIFASDKAKVYWKGEWEMINGIPTPLEGYNYD